MSTQFTADQWETYFQEHQIPRGFQLDSGSKISDPKQFVSRQIELFRHYGEGMQGKICRDRLIKVKELLEQQNKA